MIAPTVTAESNSEDSITLSWESVSGATEYQIFEYFEETGLLTMLNRTADTTITLENLELGSTHSYIVQPISYTEISDNVSPEYITTATCGQEQDTRIFLATSEENTENRNIQTSNVISPLLILGIVIGILACIVIGILIVFIRKKG